MGNKKLIIAIIVVILLIVGIISGYFYLQNNTKQARVLQEEATKLAQTDITTEEIDMEIKTKGKYAVVEEAMKNYLNDARNTYLEIKNYCNDEEISKILSPENIEADETELSVVKQKVDEYANKLEECKNKINGISEEDIIMQVIEEKKLSNYYKEIYINVMLSDETQQNLLKAKELSEEAQEDAWVKIEGLEEVVEFLADNTKYWEINDGKIQFTNVNKLTKYYELLNASESAKH